MAEVIWSYLAGTRSLLKTFLKLPKGISSHDTFGRVFAKIKPEEFQRRFIEWVQAIEKLTARQVIRWMASNCVVHTYKFT